MLPPFGRGSPLLRERCISLHCSLTQTGHLSKLSADGPGRRVLQPRAFGDLEICPPAGPTIPQRRRDLDGLALRRRCVIPLQHQKLSYGPLVRNYQLFHTYLGPPQVYLGEVKELYNWK